VIEQSIADLVDLDDQAVDALLHERRPSYCLA
jgi:hypothetical protein